MLRVTEFSSTKEEIKFAFDQIEKYHPGKAVYREKKKGFAVYRTDMWKLPRRRKD